MIVPPAEPELFVACPDPRTHRCRSPEIHRRPRDRPDFACCDESRIDGGEPVRVQHHLVREYVAVSRTGKVEIGMMREVQHGRLVCRCGVVDPQFIRIGERVHNAGFQIPRIPFLPVVAQVGERKHGLRCGGGFIDVPDHLVKPFQPPVERVGAVIDVKRILFPVQREPGFADPVPVPSHDCSEIRFPCQVRRERIVPEDDVARLLRSVGDGERDDDAAVIRDARFHPRRIP